MEGTSATSTPLPSSAGVPGPLPRTEEAPHPHEQACRPRAAPVAFKITAAQRPGMSLDLYLELLLETVLATYNTHLFGRV